eukprot:1689019-Prymnesium_polylepis.2
MTQPERGDGTHNHMLPDPLGCLHSPHPIVEHRGKGEKRPSNHSHGLRAANRRATSVTIDRRVRRRLQPTNAENLNVRVIVTLLGRETFVPRMPVCESPRCAVLTLKPGARCVLLLAAAAVRHILKLG